MTTKFFRNMAFLAKLETTEGVDASPSGGANAILACDVSVTPFNAKTAQRTAVRPFMGARAEMQYGAYMSIGGKIEMAGSDAPTTAVAYAPILRSGGLAQTAFAASAAGTIANSPPTKVEGTGAFTYAKTAAYTGNRGRLVTLECTTGGGSGTAEFTVSAPAAGDADAYNETAVVMTNATPFAIGGDATITPTVTTPFVIGDIFTIRVDPPRYEYTPISSSFESASLYFYLDGILHKGLGARCELGWTVESGIPYWTFQYNGLYVAPTDTALPAVTLTGFKDPLVAERANTPVFKLHQVSNTLTRFSGQFGNKVDPRILVNQENVPLSDRTITGSARVDMGTLATKDWFAIAKAGTLDTLEFQHGDAAGKICRIDGPQVQVKNPRYADDNGIVVIDLDLTLVPTDAGNDEIKITTC